MTAAHSTNTTDNVTFTALLARWTSHVTYLWAWSKSGTEPMGRGVSPLLHASRGRGTGGMKRGYLPISFGFYLKHGVNLWNVGFTILQLHAIDSSCVTINCTCSAKFLQGKHCHSCGWSFERTMCEPQRCSIVDIYYYIDPYLLDYFYWQDLHTIFILPDVRIVPEPICDVILLNANLGEF